MASGPKTMHGARALIQLIAPGSTTAQNVGIWMSCSYSVTYDVSAVFLLGRFSAAELVTTGLEPVNITCQGWRVVNYGPFVRAGFTSVQELLTQGDITLKVYDRQTKQYVATITGVKPTGMSSGASAKSLMDSSSSYQGLLLSDESVIQAEDGLADVATLPG
jgi:hypothetical protein